MQPRKLEESLLGAAPLGAYHRINKVSDAGDGSFWLALERPSCSVFKARRGAVCRPASSPASAGCVKRLAATLTSFRQGAILFYFSRARLNNFDIDCGGWVASKAVLYV